jgi:hypothetical protein
VPTDAVFMALPTIVEPLALAAKATLTELVSGLSRPTRPSAAVQRKGRLPLAPTTVEPSAEIPKA